MVADDCPTRGRSVILAAVPDALIKKIRSKNARVGVIGLGYVGLSLIVEFASAGCATIGFDIDADRVAAISRGESYTDDVPAGRVRDAVASGHLTATADVSALATVDTVNICVPTPLRKTKDPDLPHVLSAVDEIARHLRAGQLIILESTTYPGTVDEVVQPRLEQGGLRAGHDFFLAFSPERVDPGNADWTTRTIPKVVGGIDATSTRVAAALYEQCIDTVVTVSSPGVAEMVKLLENTFRAVNIRLVNELALMCGNLDVDVWEVIDAAKTKPFGFMPFYPGPALNGRERAVRGARIHPFGVAYKPEVSDVRESPALDIAQILLDRGGIVTYSDPFVPEVRHGSLALAAVSAAEALSHGIDCAVITTHHRDVDDAAIVDASPAAVDTRNVCKGRTDPHIFRL